MLIRDRANTARKVFHHFIIKTSRAGIGHTQLAGWELFKTCEAQAVCCVKLTSKQSNIIASQTRDGGSAGGRNWGFKAGQTEGIIMVSWFSPAVGILPDWLRILLAVIQQVNLAQGFHSGLSIELSLSVLTYSSFTSRCQLWDCEIVTELIN